jgi:hypothetical protein
MFPAILCSDWSGIYRRCCDARPARRIEGDGPIPHTKEASNVSSTNHDTDQKPVRELTADELAAVAGGQDEGSGDTYMKSSGDPSAASPVYNRKR